MTRSSASQTRWAIALLLLSIAMGAPAAASGPGFTGSLSVFNSGPGLTLTDSDQDETAWELCVDVSCSLTTGEVDQGFHISVVDNGPDSIPVIIENGSGTNLLRLDSNERIGINTSAPAVELDVRSASPELRLDDTSGGAGKVDLSMSSTTFMIEGTSDQDIIELSSSAPETIDIDASGNTVFFGDVQINSSRESKQALEEIDSGEVLRRLTDLPIHSWTYKRDAEQARHVGPMAEDFHEAFGLGGTDRSISMVDSSGIALAAIQELARRVDALAAENEELRRELDELRSSRD